MNTIFLFFDILAGASLMLSVIIIIAAQRSKRDTDQFDALYVACHGIRPETPCQIAFAVYGFITAVWLFVRYAI